MQSFLKSETAGRPSSNDFPTAEKVMYCSSNFIRKLRQSSSERLDNTLNGLAEQKETTFDEMIADVCSHDAVLIPFFADKESDEKHATVLVSLTPSKWRADLF